MCKRKVNFNKFRRAKLSKLPKPAKTLSLRQFVQRCLDLDFKRMFSGKRKGYSSYELEEIESDREELLTKASVTGREEFGGSVKTVNGHVKVMEQNPETERLLPKASVPGHDGLERIKAGKPLKVQVKVVMKEVGISSAEEMDHVHAWELLWLQSAQYPIWWYM